MRGLVIGLFLAGLFSGCQPATKSKPETLVTGGYDQAEMERAIAQARSTVDRFVKEIEQPTGTDHAVKAAVTDKGEVEHFWLTDVRYSNGVFTGKLGNEPGLVSNVRLGQTLTVKREEISDWMFIRDRKMYGNYTMVPLLPTLPPQEAEFWRNFRAPDQLP